jgi:hypothetical protein
MFIFCIAAPEAPFPKLSKRDTRIILSALPYTETPISSLPENLFADKNPVSSSWSK